MLFAPAKRLTSINEQLQRALAAAETVFDLIDQPPEEDRGTRVIEQVKGHIQLEDVSFTYPQSETKVLQHVTLDIEPGKTVALVGQSGSGKSTIINLIPRFYDLEEGRILLDQVDTRELKLKNLRDNIALVSQEVVLFDDTIAANIAYGTMNNASEGEIIEAAKAAHAWEFIEKLPDGLQTMVGENGARLSGGQRQRLAIARAFLKNAPVLLFDEATSALDTESERYVQDAMEKLRKNRTTIVIAHRLSTIQNADRIVVMQDGSIMETGNHEELLAKNGIYTRLYNMQFSQEELA
jgi:subfamily B ATP-binding cassette protein MsbA